MNFNYVIYHIPPVTKNSFTKWAPNEPNDWRGNEDCIEIEGKLFNDVSCEEHICSVCQADNV